MFIWLKVYILFKNDIPWLSDMNFFFPCYYVQFELIIMENCHFDLSLSEEFLRVRVSGWEERTHIHLHTHTLLRNQQIGMSSFCQRDRKNFYGRCKQLTRIIHTCSFSSSMYFIIVLTRYRSNLSDRSVSLSVSSRTILMLCKAKIQKPIVGYVWELRSFGARSNGSSSWTEISIMSNLMAWVRVSLVFLFVSEQVQCLVSGRIVYKITTGFRNMKLSIIWRVEFHLVQAFAISVRWMPSPEDMLSKNDLINDGRLIEDINNRDFRINSPIETKSYNAWISLITTSSAQPSSMGPRPVCWWQTVYDWMTQNRDSIILGNSVIGSRIRCPCFRDRVWW